MDFMGDESTSTSKLMLGVYLFLAIASLTVEVFTVRVFVSALQVQNWPTTKAVIVRSELESEHRSLRKSYIADIEYQYTVNDELYVSSKVRTRGQSGEHRSDIAPLLEKYQVGDFVQAYYNPSDPAESYLEAGVDVVNYIIIVSPLLFAFLFGSAFFRGLRGREVPEETHPFA